MASICIFTGAFDSFNVDRTVANVGKMLSGDFELHLVSTEHGAFGDDVFERYRAFGGESPSTLRGQVSALRGYLSENEPDVVTQIGDVPLHGNMLALLRGDIPFVCRYSGDNFYEYRVHRGVRKPAIFLLRSVVGRIPLYAADEFIAMGPRERERLVARNVPEERVSVLPPPVDERRFESVSPCDGLEVPDGRRVALFVGRRSRLKGLETLERTIPQILERRDDLQFVLVGDGDKGLNLPERFRDHVTVVGPVSPEEVPGYFKRADLLVHPSLIEGVSRSVVEALMCGIPVVARDVGDLAYATSNVFDEDEEFVEMVANFEDLEADDPSRFSLGELKEQYVEFFQRVVSEHG